MEPRQLVVLRGRLWINPSGDAHALQCVARTKRGSRCQNPVEYGQLLGLHEFQLGSVGYVQAYGSLSAGETVDTDRWLAQHCTLHDTPDVTDCETPELRRFDIVRDAAHVRAHRVDVAHDGEPVERAEEAGTTGAPGEITGSIAAVFEAAARLRPWPGYINGHQYDEWYIEATPDLLHTLARLSRTSHERELASWLEQLSKPLCMEPLDPVLSYETLPKTWCFRPVQARDLPCELHRPERAADLGRCTYAGPEDPRICRIAPLVGGDRCEDHAECCRAVKKDGEVCNRRSCYVPQHRQASSLEAVGELAAT
ncbi:hypothetical protein [Streptomyces hilarionis]|uniref:hypothetical protein n=1 Tax=Streptomyces hilarionis TaxID=2839954 RepID=UPI00211A340F|nr:hypothetical protein [Streptomyces hilarionis]MCQ9132851.1 hypothetical protein [Streptomyces hilarionis]